MVRTPSPEIMNHFSSLCLDVDQFCGPLWLPTHLLQCQNTHTTRETNDHLFNGTWWVKKDFFFPMRDQLSSTPLLAAKTRFLKRTLFLSDDFSEQKSIDPRGRPTVTAGSDLYFRTCCLSVRPSPLFKISQKSKTKTLSSEIVIATGGTVGLAEWIIDGTHILFLFYSCKKKLSRENGMRKMLEKSCLLRYFPNKLRIWIAVLYVCSIYD